MKLSAAIEYCLIEGEYNRTHEYMCHVLRDIGQREHIPAVQAMVRSIDPECNSLAGALYLVIDDSANWPSGCMFNFTKQLYCWYVFDLKRKGL